MTDKKYEIHTLTMDSKKYYRIRNLETGEIVGTFDERKNADTYVEFLEGKDDALSEM